MLGSATMKMAKNSAALSSDFAHKATVLSVVLGRMPRFTGVLRTYLGGSGASYDATQPLVHYSSCPQLLGGHPVQDGFPPEDCGNDESTVCPSENSCAARSSTECVTQWPLKTGLRFSMNALVPSRASCVSADMVPATPS